LRHFSDEAVAEKMLAFLRDISSEPSAISGQPSALTAEG